MSASDIDSDSKKADELAPDIFSVRERIDAVDDQIIELLRQRIELSSLIIQTKPPAGIIDPKREQAILNRYFEKLSEASTLPKTKRLVFGILGCSRLYPEP